MHAVRRRTVGVRIADRYQDRDRSPKRNRDRIGRRVRWVPYLIAAGLVWAGGAWAAPPEAPLVFPFSGDHRIQVIEGDELCEMIVLDEVDVERCLTLALLLDAKGRYEGTATLTFDGIGVDGSLVGEIRGSQKRRRGITALDLDAKLRGLIDVPLVDGLRAKGNLRCGGLISAAAVLDAVCEFILKRPGRGTERQEFALPAVVMGGDWTLTINTLLQLPDGKLEGSAVDSFDFSYEVRGKYDEKRDRSKLSVRGFRGSLSHGARVDIRDLETPAPSEGSGEAKYKLLGGSGKTQVNADPPI